MKRFVLLLGTAAAMSLATAEPALTSAQLEASSIVPTLQHAFEMAWQRSPAAQALASRLAQFRAEVEVAAAWTPAPPKVTLSRLTGRFGGGSDAQEWEAELGVPLWLPGQRDAQRSVASAQAGQLDLQTRAQKLELAASVREAWWKLATAMNVADLADGKASSARSLLEDVDRRWRAGDLARTDANIARAEAQAAQADAVEAKRELRAAQSAWRALTGTEPPRSLAPEAAPPLGSPNDVEANPRLLTLGAAIRLASSRLRLLDKSTRDAPELALRLLRTQGSRNEVAANAVGIRLSIPFSSAPRQARDSAGLRAELVEAQAQESQLRRQLLLDVDTAWDGFDTAKRRLELAEARTALTADTLRLTERSFALGETDLVTLLRARASAFDARAETDRQSTARALAISQLNQAMGTLP